LVVVVIDIKISNLLCLKGNIASFEIYWSSRVRFLILLEVLVEVVVEKVFEDVVDVLVVWCANSLLLSLISAVLLGSKIVLGSYVKTSCATD
jgi:hypothetical protein